jgi:hypothetical protein
VAESVTKLVLTVVFSAMLRLPVEVISVGNTLKLTKTVDYETTKNLNITVRVTDANSHTFDKTFTFNIKNEFFIKCM